MRAFSVLVWVLATAAAGQELDGGAAITPPALVRSADALYPREALALRARAKVVLELDLDVSGKVEASRLVKEDAPRSGLGFVEAATEAAAHLEFSPASIDGVPTPSTIEFTFEFSPPTLARLSGQVRTAAGAPIAQAHVQTWARLEGHTVGSRTVADAQGSFEFASLPPGSWTVEAAAAGYQRAEKSVTLVAEQGASVVLVLKPVEKNTAQNYDLLVERDEQASSARNFEDPTAVMKLTSGTSARGPVAVARGPGAGGRGGPGGGRQGGGRGGAPPGGAPPGGTPPAGGPPGGGTGGPPAGGPGGTPPTGTPPTGAPGSASTSTSTTTTASEGIPTGSANAALSPVTGSGGFDLRGNDPTLSRFFVDGIEVPSLFHFGELLRPTIARELIGGVEFYPGNFPLEYGRATIGLLSASVDERPRERVQLDVDANLADQSAVLRVPLSHSTSFFAGGTYSTVDRLLAAVIPSTQAVSLTSLPRYWDASGGLAWQPSSRFKAQALVLFSSDRLVNWPGTNPFATASSAKISEERWFGRAQGKLEWLPSDATRFTFAAGGGPEHFGGTTFEVGLAHFDARSRFDWTVLPSLTLSLGADTTMQHVEGSVTSSGSETALAKNTRWSVAEYLEGRWRPFERLEIVPGVRVESNLRIGSTVDPRLFARFELVKGVTGVQSLAIKGAVGWFHAPPPLIDLDPTIGNPDLTGTSAVHVSGGLEYRPFRPTMLSVQGFFVSLDSAIITTSATTTRGGATVPLNLTTGTGTSRGLEVFFQQQLAHGLEGWAAYTLARSELTSSSSASPISTWDQTHVLAAQLSYELPAGFKFSARFQYSSGMPTTATIGSLYDSSNDAYLPLYGSILGARTTPFRQLDLKLEKAWQLKEVSLITYLDVRNVTNASNVTSAAQYNFEGTQSATTTGLPILPLLGVRVRY